MDLYRSVSLDRSVIELPEELAVAIGVRGGGGYTRELLAAFFFCTPLSYSCISPSQNF